MAQIPVILPKLTDAEVATIRTSMNAIKTILAPKFVNLEPEDRQKFGSINEKNKLVINKVLDFRKTQESLSSPDVDWVEFEKDHESRAFLQGIMMRIDNLNLGLNSSKILHDWDNYQASLTDYDYTKYKEATGALGFQAKAAEIKQFFKGGPTSASKNSDTTAE